MNTLATLKSIVLDLVISLAGRVETEELRALLLATQTKPIVDFPTIYETFSVQVQKNSDVFDKWISLQLQLHTEISEFEKEIKKDFSDLVEQIMISNNVSGTFLYEGGELHQHDLFTLLAFRVYAPLLELEAPNE